VPRPPGICHICTFLGLRAGHGYRRLYPVGTIGVTPLAERPGTGVLWEYMRQRGSLACSYGSVIAYPDF
jgi:hypothetical protein